MASQNDVAPIIIKRKKIVVSDGHHGGAWKVAYADFVTAMMAFFMLMWLLNATTEKQRKGLADYFSPTISVNRVSGGGDKNLQGDSVFAQDTLPQNGTGATDQKSKRSVPQNTLKVEGQGTASEQELNKILRQTLVEALEGNSLMPHITARFTDEGYMIQIGDLPGAEMFDDGKATDRLLRLTYALMDFAKLTEQDVALKSGVASFPVVLDVDPTWDVSQHRVSTFRDILIQSGFDPGRIKRMTALGDQARVQENPMSIRNNRLEFVLLRQ